MEDQYEEDHVHVVDDSLTLFSLLFNLLFKFTAAATRFYWIPHSVSTVRSTLLCGDLALRKTYLFNGHPLRHDLDATQLKALEPHLQWSEVLDVAAVVFQLLQERLVYVLVIILIGVSFF